MSLKNTNSDLCKLLTNKSNHIPKKQLINRSISLKDQAENEIKKNGKNNNTASSPIICETVGFNIEPSKNPWKITHTWTLTNFDLLLKEKSPTALYSENFPKNLLDVQFLMRIVANYNKKYIALFLVLKKNNDDINGKLLKTHFKFHVFSNNNKICKSKKIDKSFNNKINCFGIENFMEIEKIQNFIFDNTVEIKCTIFLFDKYENIHENLNSYSETKVSSFLNRFSKIIKIKNFTKKFYSTNCPIIESETFFDNDYKRKFSFVLIKEKNLEHKDTGYISIYLKHCSNKILITNITWKFSILSWSKKPFVTSEGTSEPTSNDFMVGSPKFIQIEDLFNFKNDLVTNDILTLYVELQNIITTN